MQHPQYELISDTSLNTKYRFVSKSDSKEIEIGIDFEKLGNDEIYNLAFGVLTPDGHFDDNMITNNSYRNKILATVASAVFDFTKNKPATLIYFSGSSPSRTRLYRMAISINLKKLQETFIIWGLIESGNEMKFQLFNSKMNYVGFFVRRNE